MRWCLVGIHCIPRAALAWTECKRRHTIEIASQLPYNTKDFGFLHPPRGGSLRAKTTKEEAFLRLDLNGDRQVVVHTEKKGERPEKPKGFFQFVMAAAKSAKDKDDYYAAFKPTLGLESPFRKPFRIDHQKQQIHQNNSTKFVWAIRQNQWSNEKTKKV